MRRPHVATSTERDLVGPNWRAAIKKRLLARWGQRVVMLVEDDGEMRRFLAHALRKEGYRVVEVSTGDDALDRLGPWALEGRLEFAPDVIVSDIRLPYYSGLEILEAVEIAADVVPVILMTAFPDDDTLARARALGAECVLSKPFDLAELRAAVSRVLAVQ
jgi:CheY-like chemotaxis protein